MSRPLTVRKPNMTEMRHLCAMLEQSSNGRLCRWAETLLLYGAGLNAQQIAATLAIHVNTIYTCLHHFAETGVGYLQQLRRPGAPAQFTEAQVNEIAQIADQSPIEFGLPYGRWSLAKLRDYLITQRHLFKTISREHLRRVLKKRTSICVRFSVNSSATTRNAERFWLESEPFGAICPERG